MEKLLKDDKKPIDKDVTAPYSAGKKTKTFIKEKIRKLPDKKPHLDFLGALLTIPVLLTVIYLNFLQIKGKNTTNTTVPIQSVTPSPKTVEIRYISNPVTQSNKSVTPVVVTNTPQPTQSLSCTADIGPISISNPSEGTTVTQNPVCINIDYQAGNYCSVVWAYKINSSQLSDYSNNSVCLYNLPQGQNVFQLQVKSLSSASSKTLTRTFTYQGPSQASPSPTPTPSPTLTPGITVQPTPTISAPAGSH